MNFLANINWLNFGIVLLILAVLAIIFTILILLINKFCAVNEDPKIAEVSGFTDYNYFSRTFKKKTGYTPTQYKNFNLHKK